MESREAINEFNSDIKNQIERRRAVELQSGSHDKNIIKNPNKVNMERPGIKNMQGKEAVDKLNDKTTKMVSSANKEQEKARKNNIKDALKGKEIKKSSREIGDEKFKKEISKLDKDPATYKLAKKFTSNITK